METEKQLTLVSLLLINVVEGKGSASAEDLPGLLAELKQELGLDLNPADKVALERLREEQDEDDDWDGPPPVRSAWSRAMQESDDEAGEEDHAADRRRARDRVRRKNGRRQRPNGLSKLDEPGASPDSALRTDVLKIVRKVALGSSARRITDGHSLDLLGITDIRKVRLRELINAKFGLQLNPPTDNWRSVRDVLTTVFQFVNPTTYRESVATPVREGTRELEWKQKGPSWSAESVYGDFSIFDMGGYWALYIPNYGGSESSTDLDRLKSNAEEKHRLAVEDIRIAYKRFAV